MEGKKFTQLSTAIRPALHVEGKEYLYFGGTAYLGIPQNPAFLQLYLEGLNLYGTNNGTSRRNNVQLGVYEAAEQIAAERYGAAGALVSSSGYLAAQLVLKNCQGRGELHYAPHTHPALWAGHPGSSPPVATAGITFTEWAANMVRLINQSQQSHWVLVSNSVNNLFPEIYDFHFVHEIHPDKKLLMVVDDSHGIGILNDGRGILPSLPVRPNTEWIVVASMAKALGVDAGLVLSSRGIIEGLKNSNEFIGASPPAAAALYAFMHAGSIYKHAFAALMDNDARFRLLAKDRPSMESRLRSVPKFPVFLSPDAHLADKLFAKNILISSFPYPDSNSPPVNRIVLSSWHRPEQIQFLVYAIG